MDPCKIGGLCLQKEASSGVYQRRCFVRFATNPVGWAGRLAGWLAGWMAGWLDGWLDDWLAGWSADRVNGVQVAGSVAFKEPTQRSQD